MSRWFLSIPCYGESYAHTFLTRMLPSLERAAKRSSREIVLLLPGDNIEINSSRFTVNRTPANASGLDGTHADNYRRVWAAHYDALNNFTMKGDLVMPLNADMLLSEDVFEFCEHLFDTTNKKFISLAGPRALITATDEDTSSGAALYRWGWQNRHPLMNAMLWPNGGIGFISRIFFERDGNVCSRQPLTTPLAVKIEGRRLDFAPTIDVNLIHNFETDDCHVICDKSAALIELSPPEKEDTIDQPPIRDRVIAQGIGFGIGGHRRWLINHRVVLVGNDVDCGDEEAMQHILARP